MFSAHATNVLAGALGTVGTFTGLRLPHEHDLPGRRLPAQRQEPLIVSVPLLLLSRGFWSIEVLAFLIVCSAVCRLTGRKQLVKRGDGVEGSYEHIHELKVITP